MKITGKPASGIQLTNRLHQLRASAARARMSARPEKIDSRQFQHPLNPIPATEGRIMPALWRAPASATISQPLPLKSPKPDGHSLQRIVPIGENDDEVFVLNRPKSWEAACAELMQEQLLDACARYLYGPDIERKPVYVVTSTPKAIRKNSPIIQGEVKVSGMRPGGYNMYVELIKYGNAWRITDSGGSGGDTGADQLQAGGVARFSLDYRLARLRKLGEFHEIAKAHPTYFPDLLQELFGTLPPPSGELYCVRGQHDGSVHGDETINSRLLVSPYQKWRYNQAAVFRRTEALPEIVGSDGDGGLLTAKALKSSGLMTFSPSFALRHLKHVDGLTLLQRENPSFIRQWILEHFGPKFQGPVYLAGASKHSIFKDGSIQGGLLLTTTEPGPEIAYVKLLPTANGFTYAGSMGNRAAILQQAVFAAGICPEPEKKVDPLEGIRLATLSNAVLPPIDHDFYLVRIIRSNQPGLERLSIQEDEPVGETQHFLIRPTAQGRLMLDTNVLKKEVLELFEASGFARFSYSFRLSQLRSLQELTMLLRKEPDFLTRLAEEQWGERRGKKPRRFYMSGSSMHALMKPLQIKGHLQFTAEPPEHGRGWVALEEPMGHSKRWRVVDAGNEAPSKRLREAVISGGVLG